MKLTNIEQLLNGQNEATHILYGTPLTELIALQQIVGGVLDEDIFRTKKHSLHITKGNIDVVIHSQTKDKI